ncbi:hypothetical protein HAX54_023505, partial [Datura stramonium]|nr:hypothetical protein [Datura stramonium]
RLLERYTGLAAAGIGPLQQYPTQEIARYHRLGVGVTEEVTDRHTSDGGFDGHQPGDGPLLISSRSSPFSIWATEVTMDRQASDIPSTQLSLRPEVQATL